MSDEERQRARRESAEAEKLAREEALKGVKHFDYWKDLTQEDREDVEEVQKIRAMAEYAATKFFEVDVQGENGQAEKPKERVGYRDTIFMQLLMFRLARKAQQGRSTEN